jgi:catechol 2,3-dioxygenase-like lactoylglutathione lyase family enzyme
MNKTLVKFCLVLFTMLMKGISYSQSNFSSRLIGVGVVVADLERSLDFYMNGIGMVKTGGFSLKEDFAKRSGLSDGIPFSVTVLKLENSPEANEWKLMSFGKKATHPKQSFIQDDVGMQYITINVKALKPIIERLKQMKVPFLGSTPTPLNRNTQFLFVQDPDGNFVELIGPLE